MGELLTKHMWDQRHKEVVADTKKYVVQIVGRYKAAYSYCVLKKLRKNLTAKNEQTLLLEQRRWQNYNRPLHSGYVYVLYGTDQKKWRRRYCVLQPDYTLEVYDSQEDFEAANQPRYSRKHSSFEVIENIDVHVNQVVRAYMRDFGYVCDNVSNVVKKVISTVDASKRPTQHVLSLYHPFRGSFYIAADSAVEKDQWLKSLQDAQRQLSGIHCEDEIQREAFAFAIKEACAAEEHCNVSVKMCGTQEEVTADFITDYLSNGCKTMLQTKVKGDMYKKFKMWGAISSFLSVSVQKIVDSDYPPLRTKAEAEVEETKPKMLSSMPELNSIYETAAAEIISGLESSFREELVTQVLPKIPDMVTRMGESMMTPLREVKDVFVSLSDGVKRQVSSTSTEFANNIDCFFISNLDAAPRNPETMHSTFQSAIGKKSAFTILSETFPKAQYSKQETKFCVLLQKLLDSAICTFEVLCGDYVLKNDNHLQAAAVAKIEGRVLKKLSHDNAILLRQFLTETTQDVLFEMLRGLIYYDSRNKLRSYEDFIPPAFAHFLPISYLFRDAIYERLESDLRPPITAAFKHLTHDRYSMIRYHSSSTINSHSSTASDEPPSSLKHESSEFQTSSVQISQAQSSPVHVVDGSAVAESSSQEIEGSEQRGSADGSSGEPCTPPEGFVQDGETGECLEKVDENGEVIWNDVSKDAASSNIQNDEPDLEKSEMEADHGLAEQQQVHVLEKDLPVNADKPIENSVLQSETEHPEPTLEVESPTLAEAEHAVKQKQESDGENPPADNDNSHPNRTVIIDPEYGEQALPVETSQGEVLSDDTLNQVEEVAISTEEKSENGISEHHESSSDQCNPEEPSTHGQQEGTSEEKQNSVEEAESLKEVPPVIVSQSEQVLEEDLSKTEDLTFNDRPVQVVSDGDSEQDKLNQHEEDSNGLSEEEFPKDDKVREDEAAPNEDSDREFTSFAKQEEESYQIDSNGSLKQNGHSELVQGEDAPVAPARKKRASSKNKDEEVPKMASELNPNPSRVRERDLDKYNGVVEQIIHTGEEKLI